jgi:hypothetical protein
MTDFGEQFAKEFGLTNEEAMDEIKQNSSRALDFKKVYSDREADRFERLIAQQKESSSSSDDEELLAHADVRARKNYLRGSPAEREDAKAKVKALSKAEEAKALSKAKAEEAKRQKAEAAEAAEEAKRAKAEAAEEAKRAKAEAVEEAKRAKAEAAEEAKRAKQEAAEEAKRAKAEAAEEAKRAKAEAAEEAKRLKAEEAASKAMQKGGARKRAKTGGEQEVPAASSSTPRSKVIAFDYPIMCDIPMETLYYLQIALYFLIHQPNRLEACTDEFIKKVLSKKYLLQIICRMRDVALGQGMKDVPEIDEYIASVCKSSPKYPVIPMNDMSSYTKFAYWAMVTSGPLVQRFMLDKTPEEIAEHVRNPTNNNKNGFGFYDELVSMNGEDSQRLRGNSVFEDSSENGDELGTLSDSTSVAATSFAATSVEANRVKEPICYMGTTPFDPRRELMEENFVSTRPSSRSATPVPLVPLVPLVAAQKHLVVYCEDEDDEDDDIWAKSDVSERTLSERTLSERTLPTATFEANTEKGLDMDVEKPVAVSKVCMTAECPSSGGGGSSVSAFEMELVNQLKVYNENVAGIISLLRQKRSINDMV